MQHRSRSLFFIITSLLMIGLFSITSCKKGEKASSPQDPTAVDQAGQEKLKQKLAELGIPVYEGAEFFEIRKKSKDSTLLYAVYLIPGGDAKKLADVRKFYEKKLKAALVPKGWKYAETPDKAVMYRKGFEVFFVEMSTAVFVPNKRAIRIALHYGT